MRIFVVIGTRPEAIKMLPLAMELKKSKHFDTKICFSRQHRELARSVFEEFNIKADFVFDEIKKGRTLKEMTVHFIECFDRLFDKEKPELAGRWLRVSWADKLEESYHTTSQIVARDRNNLLVDVSTVFSATKTRITSLNARPVTVDGFGVLDVGIEVEDGQQLKTVMNRLEQIPGVMKVTRPTG